MPSRRFHLSGDIRDTNAGALCEALKSDEWRAEERNGEVTLRDGGLDLEIYPVRSVGMGRRCFLIGGDAEGTPEEVVGALQRLSATLEAHGLVFNLEWEDEEKGDYQTLRHLAWGTPTLRVIKLMADYGCHPVWRVEPGPGNVDPASLPISKATRELLERWAQVYDTTLDRDDPIASGFPDEESAAAFEAEGRRLWRALQKELRRRVRVLYFSDRDRLLLEPDEGRGPAASGPIEHRIAGRVAHRDLDRVEQCLRSGPWQMHRGNWDEVQLRGTDFDVVIEPHRTDVPGLELLLGGGFDGSLEGAIAVTKTLADLLDAAGIPYSLELDSDLGEQRVFLHPDWKIKKA